MKVHLVYYMTEPGEQPEALAFKSLEGAVKDLLRLAKDHDIDYDLKTHKFADVHGLEVPSYYNKTQKFPTRWNMTDGPMAWIDTQILRP